jgi:hypothetical protein
MVKITKAMLLKQVAELQKENELLKLEMILSNH